MISHFKLHTTSTQQDIDVLMVFPSHPTAILQFVHGMCDHKERYLEMMQYFSNQGYVCIIHDHLGHGHTAKTKEDLGYFGPHGAHDLVENVHEVTTYIHQIYPTLPVFLFGHSMGSLIARVYLKKYDIDIHGLILCGSPSDNRLAPYAKKLCHWLENKKGGHYRSSWVNKLAFDAFNKRFEPAKSPYSWVCKNEAIIEAYEQDPYCTFIFTVNGFYHLFDLMEQTYHDDDWALQHLDVPVHFIAGSDDPCIVSEKKFHKAVDFIQQKGYTTTSKLYPGLRHEIFNEENRQEIYHDILHQLNT